MIEIVFVGNIASCGVDAFSRHLKTPHQLLTYPCDLAEAEALVGSPISRRMIEQAPKLRLVHAAGAGCDGIALDALGGIPVCNVFHHERAIAEYVMMTILALERNLFQQDRDLRRGLWAGSCVQGPPLASEVTGKTVGILGFGHIGKEVARLATAFDMEIRSLRSGHSRVELETLLEASDFLALACPLTPETRGLIGPAEFARMRPTASLINVARGEVVDEAALYEALRDRRIRSAAVDVWYQYPKNGVPRMPSRFPFDKLDNVILTPHCSAWTERVVALRFRDIAANIDRLVAGEPLVNVVSAARSARTFRPPA
jgi:phosphoglycerate dehydrogenase-like enzyme